MKKRFFVQADHANAFTGRTFGDGAVQAALANSSMTVKMTRKIAAALLQLADAADKEAKPS